MIKVSFPPPDRLPHIYLTTWVTAPILRAEELTGQRVRLIYYGSSAWWYVVEGFRDASNVFYLGGSKSPPRLRYMRGKIDVNLVHVPDLSPLQVFVVADVINAPKKRRE